MKKNIVAALVVMNVLGMAGSALAAENPFSDVPAKHWAYGAVSNLATAGIIDGYGDGTFRGDKTMTRYEMAQIVANAMTKSDKADAKTKATLDKLAVEFAGELDKLDARVGKVEKRVNAMGQFNFDGETMIEYVKYDSSNHLGAKAFEWRQRLHMNADFNNHISFFSRLEAGDQMSQDGKAKPFQFARAGVNIKDVVGKNSVLTLGRMPIAIGRGLAFADTNNNDGIMLKNKFGKALVTSYYLSEAGSVDAAKNYIETDVTGINVDYTANKQFVANLHVFKAEKATPLNQTTNFKEAAFSYEVKKGLNLIGDVIQSDAPGDPRAYAVQLAYNWKSGMRKKMFYGWEKHVDANIAHDQGVSVAYIDVAAQSIPNYGNGLFRGWTAIGTDNVKGFAYGYENMLEKNVHFYVTYTDLQQKVGTKKDAKSVVGIEFFY